MTDSKWCRENFKQVTWDRLLVLCDQDGDGFISLQEFMAAAIKKKVLEHNKDVRKVFQILDVNDDGTISLDDFDDIIKSQGGNNKNSLWEKLLEEADLNGDGVVTF